MIVKNILLTGASSGIGEALALYYAKQPETENIFICGRNQQRLQAVKEVCEKAGTAKIHARILDVTNRPAMERWINEAEQTAPLNLVFANAGVATLEETPENIFNTFNINVMGVVNTVTPAVEIYKKRSGKDKIIAITACLPARLTAQPKPVSRLTAKPCGLTFCLMTFRSTRFALASSVPALPTRTPARCRSLWKRNPPLP